MPPTLLVLNISGVLTPSLENMIFAAVAANNGNMENPSFRSWVRENCRKYRQGELDASTLCNGIIKEAQLAIRSKAFENSFQERIVFEAEVLDILASLKDNMEIILFSEFPRSWGGSHLGPYATLSEDSTANIISLEGMQEDDPGGSYLEWVLGSAPTSKDQILFVDRRSTLTSEAVRQNINAILYVNPFRLRQELTLRGILP